MGTQRATILQIVPALDTGGAELSTIEIAEAITRAGGRALVATSGGRMLDRVRAVGAEVVILPVDAKMPWMLASNASRLARLVEREGVDLLHARSRAPAWSALAAARRTGRPFLTTYHGAYGEKGPLKRFYNSVMQRGLLVIANSAYTGELVRTRYGTPRERIVVIPRGIDPAVFDPAAIDADRRALLRARWGVTDERRIVLLAARLTDWKGQHVAIEAVRRLFVEGRLGDVVLVLAGDAQGRDDYRAGLEAAIAAGGLDRNVRLVGHESDMPAAFAAAHVALVVSTKPEAFGRTAAEAQAMGAPVIASDLGAPRETVLAPPAVTAERATGWLVPPGDAGALSAALGEALSMPADRHRAMAERARANVLARFTLETMKRATLEVYDRLLGSDLADRLQRRD